MDIAQVVDGVRDTLTVRRVFGDPYENDGVTVIPVARVQGGGGLGEADETEGKKGSGGGFGMTARPAGVFVLQGQRVRWQPAVDVNRIVLGAQAVAVVALLTARTIFRARMESNGRFGIR